MRIFLLFSFIVSTLITTCSSEEYVISEHESAIIIDGHSNDSIWRITKAYKDFYSPWSDKKLERTVVKSYHDSDFLYFHFSIIDNSLVCHDDMNYEQAVEYSDRAEIFFSVDYEMTTYYGIEIDACGRMISFKSDGYRSFEDGWQFPSFKEGDYKVKRSDNGYLVEGRISLKTLRKLGILKNRTMLVAFYRANFYEENSTNQAQWISWQDIDLSKPNFHNIQGFKPAILEDK